MSIELAELLFPDVTKTVDEIEAAYPSRDLPEDAMVTRLGPSPTGFIHMGNLYGAFVDERLAHQSGGVFYLRIEDTDEKRYVEGAVSTIINSLSHFGVVFDEGATQEGDVGDYGPYFQSERTEIYRSFAKQLVEDGHAYPCFLTENEIARIRETQEKEKITPGIYGEYAKFRDVSIDEVKDRIAKGESYVLRLKSGGKEGEAGKTISIKDSVRGKLSMPENFQDIVILKATGTPTYHFAHVVDDHLMRTTHVVRGEEWLSSLPIHEELFRKLRIKMPKYCHTAQLMKIGEDGNKRKLSKRKDPELSLDYYIEEGYYPESIKEYLLTILNSNYEQWRMANPKASSDEFKFTTQKMSKSGALFDLNKLKDVAKGSLVRVPADELAQFVISWAEDHEPNMASLLKSDVESFAKLLDVGRQGKKPRKDLLNAGQICDFISYFYDELFEYEDELPAEVSEEDAEEIIIRYMETYDHSDDQGGWFDKIRDIASDMGYATRPKDYKNEPDKYKGHVGHVSTVVRLAIIGRKESPDIWEIQQIMGEDKVRRRLRAWLQR